MNTTYLLSLVQFRTTDCQKQCPTLTSPKISTASSSSSPRVILYANITRLAELSPPAEESSHWLPQSLLSVQRDYRVCYRLFCRDWHSNCHKWYDRYNGLHHCSQDLVDHLRGPGTWTSPYRQSSRYQMHWVLEIVGKVLAMPVTSQVRTADAFVHALAWCLRYQSHEAMNLYIYSKSEYQCLMPNYIMFSFILIVNEHRKRHRN